MNADILIPGNWLHDLGCMDNANAWIANRFRDVFLQTCDQNQPEYRITTSAFQTPSPHPGSILHQLPSFLRLIARISAATLLLVFSFSIHSCTA